MTCKKTEDILARYEDRELPPELRGHVADCPDCRREQAQQRGMRQLMALRRFERPDVHFETRNLARVREAVAATALEESSWLGRVGGWISTPLPSFQYALGVVMVGLAAAYLVVMPPLNESSTDTDLAVLATTTPPTNSVIEYHMAAQTLPPAEPGRGSLHIEYGPGPSVPVNYQY